MPKPLLLEARDIPQAWKILVPEYKSAQYRPLLVQIEQWDSRYAHAIRRISERRSINRINNYLGEKELDRVGTKLQSKSEVAIRFGVSKSGHGYHGERGDFCLVGGAIDGRNLSLFYRSLELIGGLAYDLVLVDHLGQELGIEWKRLTIMAANANIFAVHKNSNEKLYPKIQRILNEN